MSPASRRALLVIALITTVAMLIGKSNDFLVYHQAVRALFTSGWDGVYRADWVTPFKYQPPTLFLFIPFALLPWLPAKILWAVANGAAVWDLQRRLVRFGIPLPAIIAGFVLVIHGMTWHIKFANVTVVMTWLLVVVATTRHPWSRAGAVAVLILLKPFWLALLPVFVLARDAKGLARIVGLLAVVSLLPFLGGLEWGTHAYQAWLPALTGEAQTHNYPKNDNQSVFALLYSQRTTLGTWLVPLWGVLAAAALAGWAVGVRWITNYTAFALGPVSVAAVILWTGPLSWIHHQVLLWPLFAWLWLVRRERGMMAVLLVSWLLLNGTGGFMVGRDGFVWTSQARIPILAFPLLLGAVAWYRTALLAAIPDGDSAGSRTPSTES
jgi:hypothetical protein